MPHTSKPEREKRELMRDIEKRLPPTLRRARNTILRNCVAAGVKPDKRHRWRYSEVLQALQSAHARDYRTAARDPGDPKTRKLVLEGDRIEHELKVARGEVVSMDEHRQKINYLCQTFSAALQGVPERIAAYTRDPRTVEIARTVCHGVADQIKAQVVKA